MKALAEEPPGMRRHAVIVAGERPAGLALPSDMPQVAAFGDVAAESAALQRRFFRRRAERRLSAARGDEAVGGDPASGAVIGGEFPDRQPAGRARRQRVGGVMILVAALEGRHPQRRRRNPGNGRRNVAGRCVEFAA